MKHTPDIKPDALTPKQRQVVDILRNTRRQQIKGRKRDGAKFCAIGLLEHHGINTFKVLQDPSMVASWNDWEGMSFSEIAKKLEDNPRKYFMP